MKFGEIILGSVSFLAVFPIAAEGAERPIVAVFKIEDKSRSFSSANLDSLTEILVAEIGKAGVFQVVPPGEIKRALTQKKKESLKECYDQQCQIELGRELAANKTLSLSIVKVGSSCTLTAALYDLKKMATDITSNARSVCTVDDLVKSLEQVGSEIRAWTSGSKGTAGFQEGEIGGKQEEWAIGGGDEVLVKFSSAPPGATVLLDGNLLCRATPCRKSVAAGAHEVAIQAEKYEARRERLVLAKGSKVEWTLKPNFGWLTVRSNPSGLEVKINSESSGQTPVEKMEIAPGGYEVVVESPCYHPTGERVKIERGQEKAISVEPQERLGAIKVKARDKNGDDLEADVLVGGTKIGTTPGTFKVSVCAQEVEIRHRKQGNQKQEIEVKEREVFALDVKLKGAGVMEWIYSKPAKIEFTKSEITVAQYLECMDAGSCTPPMAKNESKGCNWGYADRDNHPVNCVDWNQSDAFCRWAGGRLPTEGEWFAEASAGGKRKYPWGNEQVTCEYAIWSQGGDGCGKDSTWPVCSKPKGNSVSGLCDMSGNVWEWTSSSRGSTGVVVRGGSWGNYGPDGLLALNKDRGDPSDRSNSNIGFRCGRPSQSASQRQPPDESRVCTNLEDKLCKDIGQETKTCELVRFQTKKFPSGRCEFFLKNYDQVLADLKAREAEYKPLTREQQEMIAGDTPASFGPKDGKITIVEFFDFQCPYSLQAAKAVKALKAKYSDRIRVVFRNFPLSFHKYAHLASQAAMAAAAQGKFFEYYYVLFENQQRLARENLEEYVKRVKGLDLGKLKKALDEKTYAKVVDADVELGNKVAVRGTPTIFINGALVFNPTDVDSLSKEIEQANRELGGGAAPL